MSDEHERLILGAIIKRPAFLREYPVTLADFSKEIHRRAFALIAEIEETERPAEIDRQKLADRLGNGVFVADVLAGLQKVTPEVFAYNLRQARKARVRRSLQALVQDDDPRIDLNTAGIRAELDIYEETEKTREKTVESALQKGSALQALEIKIEYIVDHLIPRAGVTVLHGPGGIGKTWILLQAASAVSSGSEFMGLPTQRRPVVFVAFEDPLPILAERVRRLDIRDVLFWHLGADPRPPKLDASDYALYRELPAGALIIIDTLRSAHDGDENSSRDISLIMGRLKELREAGFDIVVNHHTGKASDRIYKGSTAISDLADHVLALHKVKKGTLEEIVDDAGPGPDDFFRLGTAQKTRYEPFHVFLNFSPDGGFMRAEDPDDEDLEALREFFRDGGGLKTQADAIEFAKRDLGIGKKLNALTILKKGERLGKWTSRRDGKRRFYDAK